MSVVDEIDAVSAASLVAQAMQSTTAIAIQHNKRLDTIVEELKREVLQLQSLILYL